LIEYARQCEEAAHKVLHPPLWPERYFIIETLDKVQQKAGIDFILKPIFSVQGPAKESEDEFVARMTQLEIMNGEIPVEKDWVRIYSRYVELKDKGDESGLHLEVS
jgi:hypothetical protein